MLTAEPERTTKPKMAKHLLIEVQHEMHLQTGPLALALTHTLTLGCRYTKGSCTLCLECPSDLHRRVRVVLISRMNPVIGQ